MIFTVNKSIDCYFNLALEEYFLRERTEDVFMLWQNANTIVVGKNQNTLSEINSEFVRENGIRVVRRITGGGAVYHDLGNINFSFITKADTVWQSDFTRFAVPVIDALRGMGVHAEMSGRNDITVGDRKISGNAQTVINGRILHHGTLLFDTDMTVLSRALAPDETKIQSKGIKSIASRVVNISELLGRKATVVELIDRIGNEVRKLPNVCDYTLTSADCAAAERLADEKYRTWEWTFGYSPKYTHTKKKRFPSGSVEACLSVCDGKIASARFFGDFFGVSDTEELEVALCGICHRKDGIAKALQGFDIGSFFGGISLAELLELLV